MTKAISHKPRSKKSLVSFKRNLVKKKGNLVKKSSQAEVKTTPAMDRALVVQANLSPQLPSCVKLMLKSHVSSCYWLGLDKKFCVSHLPNHEAIVVLVDEDGKEHKTKYLAHRNGLSGGWKGFSIAKKLRDGDVVIFQRIAPCKLRLISDYDPATDKFGSDANNNWSDMNSDSEISEGIRFSQRDVNFRNVKKFEDFTIQVDGLNLDSQIPTHLRRKYYKLCSSQNMFLHENLIEGLNCNLSTGVISETINIADAIREVKSAKKSFTRLESWDRTLMALEDLGMRVGFLRDRISKLIGLYRESQAVIELKRSERDEAENEMRCLKEKLRSVGTSVKMLDLEINDLVGGNAGLDSEFMEVACASW